MYPPSGACDYSVELPHRSFCSRFVVCLRFGVVGLEWYPCCRLNLQPATRKSYAAENAHNTTCCHSIELIQGS